MGKGGGGSSSTTVQKADPWIGLQPSLTNLYDSANNWYNSASPQYYPNSTIGDLSPLTTGAQGLGAQRALMGNSGMQLGQGQLNQTIGGGYLGSNPYLDSMFNSAASGVGRQFSQNVLPGIASMFSGAGRTGSGAEAGAADRATQAYGDTLGRMGSSIYGGAYESERGRQMQAMGMAPAYAANDYTDIAQLANIGRAQEGRTQDELNADIQRFQFAQNRPLSKLQDFNALLNGGMALSGTTASQQAQRSGSPLAGAAGGAMMGYSALPYVGGALADAGMGMAAGGMGPSSFLAAGAANPAFWPLLIGGGLLGGLFS